MAAPVRLIVVFESRPRWEPELQRQFRQESVCVRSCRSWSELSSLVFPTAVSQPARSPLADLAVIDLAENAVECLQWLSKLTVSSRAPLITILCPSESAELEWPLREAGVREVLVGEVSGELVARNCRSLLRTL